MNLTIGSIVSDGFRIGLKNFPGVFIALVVWAVTIWIPYVNVGTTIAVMGGIAVALSKGEPVSPLEIFSSSYRRYTGEFFLLMSFALLGVHAGLLFLFIPGIVIGIAWSQSLMLLVDRGTDPAACLSRSNDMTYGHKWTIFLGYLILSIILMVAVGIVGYVARGLQEDVGHVVTLLASLAAYAIALGAQAHIYAALSALVPAITDEPVDGPDTIS